MATAAPPADYHMHTPLCRHARGEPEEYARRAIERGLTEIGFSDHGPMPPDYDPEFRMTRGELDGYVASVQRCRAAHPSLTIRLGIEADFHPGTEAYVEETLRAHPYDYVIGSIHYLGDWGFDNPDQVHRFGERDVWEIYAQYYGAVKGLARSGLFDILGHPDVVKKFGHRPSRDYAAMELEALDALAGAGMALDVNTSGLRRPAKETYPSLRILRAARERGIGITFGSDAHEPGHVGEAFGEAVALAREAGYATWRRYAGRRYEEVGL